MATVGTLGGHGRNLRACMVCSIIQPQATFVKSGCPNCEEVINYANSPEQVQDCTSPNFNGVIHLARPEDSWVARWKRLDTYVPGIYAVQVIGILPPEVKDELRDAGIRYVPRDGGEEEELEEQ